MRVPAGVLLLGVAAVLVTPSARADTTLEAHSDGPAELEMQSPDGWRHVCALPCTTAVDPRFRYRIAGAWMASSPTFTVRRDEHQAAFARLRPLPTRIAGYAFVGVGVGAVLAATTLALCRSIPEGDWPDGPTSKSTVVTLTMTLGGLMTAIGVTLLSLGGSEVSVERGEPELQLSKGIALTPSGVTF